MNNLYNFRYLLDDKYALRSTKGIIAAYYDKEWLETVFCCIKPPMGLRPIRRWLDGRVKARIFMCYLSYVVVTNPKGDLTTSKWPIPSTRQRQIMDVLNLAYIKSEI